MCIRDSFEIVPKSEVEELVLEEVPDIRYQDIGGLGEQIDSIRDAVELPFMHPDLFAEVVDAFGRLYDPLFDALADYRPPLVHFCDNISGETVGSYWDRFMLPLYRERLDQLHAAGIVAAVVLGVRATRGTRGESSRRGMLYGFSWWFSFMCIAGLSIQIGRSGADPEIAGLIANGSGGRIFGVGATLSLASLRNVVLLAAAVALISHASLGLSGVLVAAGIFLLASSLGVLAPLLVYLFGGAGASSRLEAGGGWLQRNLVWVKIIVLAAVGLGYIAYMYRSVERQRRIFAGVKTVLR